MFTPNRPNKHDGQYFLGELLDFAIKTGMAGIMLTEEDFQILTRES